MTRNLGAIVLAYAAAVVPSPAIACICVTEPVTVVLAKGRVFALGGPSGAEAIRAATVELRRWRDDAGVSATTTDADGLFELETPPPGDYSLRVSLEGFHSTVMRVRIKKGSPNAPGRLVVRLDVGAIDCACGDACVAKSDRTGNVEPKCLVERSKVSLTRVQPPNDELQRTRPAQATEPRR